MDSLRPDTGIPEGVRISVGGNMHIANSLGGSMTIEYETFRLRKKEAFLVFIDSLEVLKVEAGNDTEHGGFSSQKWDTKTFDLEKGDHLI